MRNVDARAIKVAIGYDSISKCFLGEGDTNIAIVVAIDLKIGAKIVIDLIFECDCDLFAEKFLEFGLRRCGL